MKKTLLILLAVLLLGGAFTLYFLYRQVAKPNVKLSEKSRLVYLPPGADGQTVYDSLAPYLLDSASFFWVAEKKSYLKQVKPGRYRIKDGWSNEQLIDHLRAGDQEPLNVVIHNVSNFTALAELLGAKLAPPTERFARFFSTPDSLAQLALDRQSRYQAVIPNTYEFYWTSPPETVLKKLQKSAEKFWEEEAAALERSPLNRHEVVTLASIVQSETSRPDEMPQVAELYLNRLEQGIKLQSDPTVIYAVEKAHPELNIRRVLYRHLRFASPYNTYRHKGLPPGPIRLPGKEALEAVLHPAEHDYIFMVADPEKPGYHLFAKTLKEHNQNRRRYIQWLNRQK